MKEKKDTIQLAHTFTYVQHHFDVIEKRILYNMLCRMDTGINVQPELFSKNMTFSFNWKDLNTDFKQITTACDRLMERTMPIEFDIKTQKYHKMKPFPECKIKDGVVKIVVYEKAVPFFLELQKGYTTLGLKAALSLRSKYSQRFYEMLSAKIWREKDGSLRNVNKWPCVPINELRDLLGIDFNKLKQKKEFDDRVLKVAQAEILANTDISFEFKYDENTKIGKTYQTISFTVYPRKNGAEWEELKMDIADDIAHATHKDKFAHAIMLLSVRYKFTEAQKAIILHNQKAIDILCRVDSEIENKLRVIKKTPQDYMFSCLKEFLFS